MYIIINPKTVGVIIYFVVEYRHNNHKNNNNNNNNYSNNNNNNDIVNYKTCLMVRTDLDILAFKRRTSFYGGAGAMGGGRVAYTAPPLARPNACTFSSVILLLLMVDILFKSIMSNFVFESQHMNCLSSACVDSCPAPPRPTPPFRPLFGGLRGWGGGRSKAFPQPSIFFLYNQLFFLYLFCLFFNLIAIYVCLVV